MKAFKRWGALALLTAMAVSIAYATVTYVTSYKVAGSYVWILQNDGSVMEKGALKMGDTLTGSSLTLPTTTTGSNFSRWIPVKNIGSAAATQGDILCSSNTGTGYVSVCPGTSDLKTVLGVAAESIASGATGWMVGRGGGYAVIHTTGTVNIGDILVSTSSASGYATGNNSPTTGAYFGHALSAGTSSGGSVLALID